MHWLPMSCSEAIIASLWPRRHSSLMEGSKSVSTDDWRLRSGPSDSFFFVFKKTPLCVIASAAMWSNHLSGTRLESGDADAAPAFSGWLVSAREQKQRHHRQHNCKDRCGEARSGSRVTLAPHNQAAFYSADMWWLGIQGALTFKTLIVRRIFLNALGIVPSSPSACARCSSITLTLAPTIFTKACSTRIFCINKTAVKWYNNKVYPLSFNQGCNHEASDR